MALDQVGHHVPGPPLLAGGLGLPLVSGHRPDGSVEAVRHLPVPVLDVGHRRSLRRPPTSHRSSRPRPAGDHPGMQWDSDRRAPERGGRIDNDLLRTGRGRHRTTRSVRSSKRTDSAVWRSGDSSDRRPSPRQNVARRRGPRPAGRGPPVVVPSARLVMCGCSITSGQEPTVSTHGMSIA
jgi:hypothetical protein